MSDPYWFYQDKVDYDYIIKVNMPIKYYVIGDEDDKDIHESQYEQISENIQTGIESLISNEDYNGEYFPEVCLGGVYPGVNEVSDDIEMYFGIITRDARGEITLDELKEDILEYMWNLNSNIDYDSSVSGFETEDENVEPKSIAFEPKGKRDDIKMHIEVLKEPKKESLDIDNIDRKLVNEGSLSFKKENSLYKLVLNDEGKVEQFVNEQLTESFNFSKSSLLKKVNELLSESYELFEAESLDLEQSKEELEQGIELVDELQTLKDELTDKIDTLVNESKEFPSTEFTKRQLNVNELDLLDLTKSLTPEQIEYIETNVCSLEELKEGLLFLLELTGFKEELISIDDYVKQLKENKEVINND